MHDLHIANKIYQLVLDEARRNKLRIVKKIIIEIGRIVEHNEEVNADNLKFNIQALARESLAGQAEIKITKKSEGNYWKLVAIEGE